MPGTQCGGHHFQPPTPSAPARLPRAAQDVYTRRVACAFGGGKERRSGRQRPIVIDFVVAGQVAQFRAVERFGPGVIQEMPVHVADIFVGP